MTSLNDNETLLLQETLRYASAFLEENKEFYPFGMVMERHCPNFCVNGINYRFCDL